MKLKKEKIVRTADASPFKLFKQGIKTEMTRRKYTATGADPTRRRPISDAHFSDMRSARA